MAARWREALARIPSARALLLGVPSDVGAGVLRGSNLGPQAIRSRLVEEEPDFFALAAAAGLVDVGDVFVVPQLLHDEMLSTRQLEATRAALYPGLPAEARALLPVSPLSIAERVARLLSPLAPQARGCSCSAATTPAPGPPWRRWPLRTRGWRWSRWTRTPTSSRSGWACGYCFATWSFHASRLLGPGRLVQVGIRASRRDRAHWESTTGARQLWAAEVLAAPERALDRVVELLREAGASSVYLSNDIDGTDAAHAAATGTPEPGGLDAAWVSALIARLGREFRVVGGDVMEVAPPLASGGGEPARTLALAARYLRQTLAAALGRAG